MSIPVKARLKPAWRLPHRHGTPNELPTFTEFDCRISRAKVLKGELLWLTWEQVSLDNAELYMGEQFQLCTGPAVHADRS